MAAPGQIETQQGAITIVESDASSTEATAQALTLAGGAGEVPAPAPTPRRRAGKRARSEVLLEREALSPPPQLSTINAPGQEQEVFGSVEDIPVIVQPQNGGYGDFDDIVGADGEAMSAQEYRQYELRRVIAAVRRKRRLGSHLDRANIAEDMAEVKAIMALKPEEREDFLTMYEFDTSGVNLVGGLAKATRMCIRGGLMKWCLPKNFDLVNAVVDKPDFQDALETMWECADVGEFVEEKHVRLIASLGHVGDSLVTAFMKIKSSVDRVGEERDRMRSVVEQSKASHNGQSSFSVPQQQPPPISVATACDGSRQPNTLAGESVCRLED